MTYLERLRNSQSGKNHSKKSSQPYSEEVAKGAKGAFDTFETSPRGGTQLFSGAKVGKVDFQLPANEDLAKSVHTPGEEVSKGAKAISSPPAELEPDEQALLTLLGEYRGWEFATRLAARLSWPSPEGEQRILLAAQKLERRGLARTDGTCVRPSKIEAKTTTLTVPTTNCWFCKHFRPMSATCLALPTTKATSALSPPCGGQHFAAKGVRP